MGSERAVSWPAGDARRGWQPQLRGGGRGSRDSSAIPWAPARRWGQEGRRRASTSGARGACARAGRQRSRQALIARERALLDLRPGQHRHAFGDLSKGLLGLPLEALVAAQGERLEVGANHLPFIRMLGQRVLGEYTVLVADDEAVLGLANPNLPSRVFSWGRLPAAGVADKAVAGDPSTLQNQGSVRRQILDGAQALFGQPVDWSLTGGAVDADVAGLVQPAPAEAEQVVGGFVVADPRPEVLAHVANAVLGLALGLRTVWMTELGSKAVVLGEVDEARMEDRVAVVVVMQPDRLDAVIENLFGHATEIVKGLLVTGEEKRQRLAVGEVEVLRTRPAEGHHETLDPLPPWLLEWAPVDLRLMSKWGFEAHRRLLLGHGAERMHELFEDAATTAVTELVDLVIENFSVAHRVLTDHASQQVLAEGVELGADLSRLAPCLSSLAQQPANRLAVAPALTRNLAD